MRPVLAAAALAAALALPGGAAAAAPVLGVYAEDGLSVSPEVRSTAAALQQGARIRSVRLPLNWREAEPERDRHEWARMDAAVLGAARHGIEVLPFLFDSPAWASGVEPAYGDAHPPRDPADFARFAAAAVARYGPGGAFWAEHPEVEPRPIRSWEVWNEPNLVAFWQPRPDARAYTALLRAAAAAIRAQDPTAEVLIAGLPDSTGGVGLVEYLDAMYRAGAKGTFDALSIHAYAPDPHGVLAVIHAARRVAARHGDRKVPTWVTEYGWASGGEDSMVTADEAGQAALLARTVRLMRRVAGPWRLRGLHYFNWADPVRPEFMRDIWPFHTGLLRADGSAKPALRALTRAYERPIAGASAKLRPRAPRRVGLKLRVRSVRRAAVGRGLKVRLRCGRTCDAGLAVLAEQRREGRGPLRHVSGRFTRKLRARKWRTTRLRLSAAEVAWLRAHPAAELSVRATALSGRGGLGARGRAVPRARSAKRS